MIDVPGTQPLSNALAPSPSMRERLLRHAEFSCCLCHDVPDFDPRLSISELDKSVLTYLQQPVKKRLWYARFTAKIFRWKESQLTRIESCELSVFRRRTKQESERWRHRIARLSCLFHPHASASPQSARRAALNASPSRLVKSLSPALPFGSQSLSTTLPEPDFGGATTRAARKAAGWREAAT